MKLILEEILTLKDMSAPTAAQIDILLNFLEEHRDLARGNLRRIEGRMLSQQLWEQICTTLNAMGGCTKTTKQWQKVWTDKKYLAKKAAVAARSSSMATGGGPSTAPSLSQWEKKVISIMGDGFGEPQTSARVPAFVENSSQETTGAPTLINQDLHLNELEPTHVQPSTSQQDTATKASDASIKWHQTTPRRKRRALRRQLATPRLNSSVRDRFFDIEERRMLYEKQRNIELAGIRMAVVELCSNIQQLTEVLHSRSSL